jgi:hypothetical protein
MPPRLRAMLADLRDMKRELLPGTCRKLSVSAVGHPRGRLRLFFTMLCAHVPCKSHPDLAGGVVSGPGEKNDPAAANMDDYGRKMLDLTKLLAEIRVV